jgi:hypothetical protein
MAVSLVKWESRADPFPGGAPHRISPAADSGTAWHVCFDDEDTGGHPAGQQQARCLRDFPGHVASHVDAIFPERPCGRVLGAASSDRMSATDGAVAAPCAVFLRHGASVGG